MPELDFDRDVTRQVARSVRSDEMGYFLGSRCVGGGEIFLSTLEMRIADAMENGGDVDQVMADYRERMERVRG